MSNTISRAPPISHLVYCRCGILYTGETGRSLRTRFGEHRRASLAMMLTSLLPDILILAIPMFQLWKCAPSVPFLVATIATKYMTHYIPVESIDMKI
jgi:hypothetical protein